MSRLVIVVRRLALALLAATVLLCLCVTTWQSIRPDERVMTIDGNGSYISFGDQEWIAEYMALIDAVIAAEPAPEVRKPLPFEGVYCCEITLRTGKRVEAQYRAYPGMLVKVEASREVAWYGCDRALYDRIVQGKAGG